MADTEKIFCGDCKSILTFLTEKCPVCNSTKKEIRLELQDNLTLYDSIGGKKIDKTKTGKNKVREEFFEGNQQSANGSWVYKKRIISREKDYYYERVTDTNGIDIRFCEEKLSEHRDRGSAKNKDKTDLKQ